MAAAQPHPNYHSPLLRHGRDLASQSATRCDQPSGVDEIDRLIRESVLEQAALARGARVATADLDQGNLHDNGARSETVHGRIAFP